MTNRRDNREASVHDLAVSAKRARLIEQLRSRGIRDERVLSAIEAVPREVFVEPDLEIAAYDDRPLPIGGGQTISQPYIVALMLAALELRGTERVLEVGAGSGYAAAVLSKLSGVVHAVERRVDLIASAKAAFRRAKIEGVCLHCGDGSHGWPAAEPYDAILVSAAAEKVPSALINQLRIGGRLVVPVGPRDGTQWLLRLRRVADGSIEEQNFGAVQFVPLLPGIANED